MRKVCSRTGRSWVRPVVAKAGELKARGTSREISACACGALAVGESALYLSGRVSEAGVAGATEQQPSLQDCAIVACGAVAGALMWSRLKQHSMAAG